MTHNCFKTPILFIVFNRPDTTQVVFDRIRQIKPNTLYIAADGAREQNHEDQRLCDETRGIISQIDWDCEIKTLFSRDNKGCKKGVVSAIDWFFENEESGIILEDDCVPESSFFYFCEELLKRYEDDHRVSSISGSNPFPIKNTTGESYFFTRYSRIWGWATWRRAWKNNDVEMKQWPDIKNNGSHYDFFLNSQEAQKWEKIWDDCHAGEIDTWDFQWFFSKLVHFSCTIVSYDNLIQNIGCGHAQATHTKKNITVCDNVISKDVVFPLIHPKSVSINYNNDKYLSKKDFGRLRRMYLGVHGYLKKYSIYNTCIQFLKSLKK